MKLYGHPFSGNARRVQMLCEEAGIAYDYQIVDLMAGAQYAPEFLALNPNGKVPVIEDDGFVLWESHAIMRYLADKHRLSDWYPSELKERAKVDAWLEWNHSRLGMEAGKLAFHTLFLRENGDPARIADAHKWLEKILLVMDAQLTGHAYLCGDDPTLPDLSAATNTAYLEACKYDLSAYPSVLAWYKRMKGRQSFQNTPYPDAG